MKNNENRREEREEYLIPTNTHLTIKFSNILRRTIFQSIRFGYMLCECMSERVLSACLCNLLKLASFPLSLSLPHTLFVAASPRHSPPNPSARIERVSARARACVCIRVSMYNFNLPNDLD